MISAGQRPLSEELSGKKQDFLQEKHAACDGAFTRATAQKAAMPPSVSHGQRSELGRVLRRRVLRTATHEQSMSRFGRGVA